MKSINRTRDLPGLFFRNKYIFYSEEKSKGEMKMFKNKEVRESTLKKLMGEAIDDEDWKLVKELRSIEKEQDIRVFEERINSLVVGYGAAITCVIIGGIVTKVIISKLRYLTIEG